MVLVVYDQSLALDGGVKADENLSLPSLGLDGLSEWVVRVEGGFETVVLVSIPGWVVAELGELDELGAYGTFRIALSQLIVGESQAGAFAALDQGLIDYAGTVNVGLIEAFKRGYEATDNYAGGCLAVREHIAANLDAFQAVWEYGYANPPFEPERFCPF